MWPSIPALIILWIASRGCLSGGMILNFVEQRRNRRRCLGEAQRSPLLHLPFPFCNVLPTSLSSLSLTLALGSSREYHSCSCCSVVQLRLTLYDPTYSRTPGFPVLSYLPELGHELKLMSIESVMPSNHLIVCHPLLLLSSIFPSIWIFSNEWALHLRWPTHWSLDFSKCMWLANSRVSWMASYRQEGPICKSIRSSPPLAV